MWDPFPGSPERLIIKLTWPMATVSYALRGSLLVLVSSCRLTFLINANFCPAFTSTFCIKVPSCPIPFCFGFYTFCWCSLASRMASCKVPAMQAYSLLIERMTLHSGLPVGKLKWTIILVQRSNMLATKSHMDTRPLSLSWEQSCNLTSILQLNFLS